MGQALGSGTRFGIQFAQSGFECAHGGRDGGGAAEALLHRHDHAVDLLVDWVVSGGLFEDGQREVALGVGEQFGEAGVGVDGLTLDGQAVGFGPFAANAVDEGALVEVDRVMQGRDGLLGVARPLHERRERALCLARMATAHLRCGDLDQAAAAGVDACRLGQPTQSERIKTDLRALVGRVSVHRQRPAVARLIETATAA